MVNLLKRLAVVWCVVGTAIYLTGCGAVEVYGGIRRADSRRVVEDTIPTPSLWEWMTNGFKSDTSKERKA